jgi:hypothetical protein
LGVFGGCRAFDGRVGVGLRDQPAVLVFAVRAPGAPVVVVAVFTVGSGLSVPEGQAEARLPVIHPPARCGGMVIYGRARMGSISEATTPPAGGGQTWARSRIRSR